MEGEEPVQTGKVTITARRSPFAPGSLVGGKYRVEHELAEGGLGIVVVATHAGLGQKVAIKYLKPSVLERKVLVERFQHEAQLAASIRSDHVVRIYDVGVLGDAGPYMVMEYLEGEDLGTRLGRGPIPESEAVDYIVQACDALAEAHAMGIIHRDLKPENLFLARRKSAVPILKILDFGLSKVSERKNASAGAPRARQMTEDGERFGTPSYMSPEQFRESGGVDIRSDIWSLGVVLFELVTGELPFEGDGIAELAANILTATPVPLRKKVPGANRVLEAVILKCLEKDRTRRYRNVAELVDELASFGGPASEPRTDRIRRLIVDGGESVRPPRPIRETPDFDQILPMLPPTEELAGPVKIGLIPTPMAMPVPAPLLAKPASLPIPTPALPIATPIARSNAAPIVTPFASPAASPLPPSVGSAIEADEIGDGDILVSVPPPAPRRALVLAAVGVVLFLALGVGIFALTRGGESAATPASSSSVATGAAPASPLAMGNAAATATGSETPPVAETAATSVPTSVPTAGSTGAPAGTSITTATATATAPRASSTTSALASASARVPTPPPAAASASAKKKANDYSEFGERR